MGRWTQVLGAIGTGVVVAAAATTPAWGAASDVHVTRGAGNQLVLSFTESTKTYGLQWWLDGTAYAITDIQPALPDCTKLSHDTGTICTFLPPRTGAVTVTLTLDKYVSPNTNTNVEIDSDGAEDQTFRVLVEGGTTPTPPPEQPKPPEVKPPVEDPKKKQEKKDAAKADFDLAWKQALADCSMASVGASLGVTGALSTGVNPFLGLSAETIGALMTDMYSPLCGLSVARLKLDADIYNDPPDANFGQVALPAAVKASTPRSCKKAKRRGRAGCVRVTKAAAALTDASRRVGAVVQALSTTMNRASGAVAADDAAGYALQDASHAVLSGMLAKAIRDQNRASATFAKRLAAVKVRPKLNAKAVKKGAQQTQRKVTAAGVPAATLQQLAGPPSAKPIDVLKQLRTPTSTAGYDALARGLTAQGATAYLTAAAAQLHSTPEKVRAQLVAAGAVLP